MATETDEQVERRPTERVILQRARAIVIPEDALPETIAQAVEVLYPKAKRAQRDAAAIEAWTEVARHEAASKRAAIVAHTGEPGTADARVGEFRAVSAAAWRGGLRLVAPARPLIEAEVFE